MKTPCRKKGYECSEADSNLIEDKTGSSMKEIKNNLLVLLQLREATVKNSIKQLKHESRLKIAFVTVFGSLLWIGLFLFFLEGFNFISVHLQELKSLLTEYLLLIFFITLLLMLAVSNGIIAYTALFKSKETSFLAALPVTYKQLFLYKFSESIFFSSWAIMLLGIPLLAAYGIDRSVAWHFYPVSFSFLLLFILIPAEIGGFSALVITRYFPKIRRYAGWGLAAAAALLTALAAFHFFSGFSDEELFTASGIKSILEKLGFSRNPFLPSYWTVRGITEAAKSEWSEAIFYWFLLLSNAAFGFLVCLKSAGFFYKTAWSASQTPMKKQRKKRKRSFYAILDHLLFFLNHKSRLLVIKDVKTFFRDPSQWSQTLIFFGLLGVYILNLRNLSYDITSRFWKNLISVINVSAAGLTLSTFTGRFVFPTLSLEGRKFWLLGLMPIRRRSILFCKFFFSLLLTLFISEPLIFLSDWMLMMSWDVILFHAGLIFLICLGLSGLAVGLGATFPIMTEDNPSRIVSSYGGTLNFILSLIFIGLIIGLTAIPFHFYAVKIRLPIDNYNLWLTLSIVGAVVISLAAALIPMAAGIRSFERREF